MHLRQENQKIREICKGVLKALGGWVRQSGVLVSPLAGWLAGWLVGWLAGWLAARPVCLPACLPVCLPACMPARLLAWPAGRLAGWPAVRLAGQPAPRTLSPPRCHPIVPKSRTWTHDKIDLQSQHRQRFRPHTVGERARVGCCGAVPHCSRCLWAHTLAG